jgi:hypothetical protein
MSAQLMGRVFRVDLPAHLKLLLLALADEATDEGRGICVGQATLAIKVGASDRTVRANLEELRRRGLVRRLAAKHPKYHTDQYEIAVRTLRERPEDVAGAGPEEVSGRSAPEGVEPQVNDGAPATDRQDLPAEVQRVVHRKSGVVSTGSGLPPTQELPVEATQLRGRRRSPAPRPRRVDFDSLSSSVGLNPRGLTRDAAELVATKLADIRDAETERLGAQPEAEQLAGEIAMRALRFRRRHPTWELTPGSLAKWWPELGPEVPRPELVRELEPPIADEDRPPPDEATIRRAIASHRRGCELPPGECDWDRQLQDMLDRIPQAVYA